MWRIQTDQSYKTPTKNTKNNTYSVRWHRSCELWNTYCSASPPNDATAQVDSDRPKAIITCRSLLVQNNEPYTPKHLLRFGIWTPTSDFRRASGHTKPRLSPPVAFVMLAKSLDMISNGAISSSQFTLMKANNEFSTSSGKTRVKGVQRAHVRQPVIEFAFRNDGWWPQALNRIPARINSSSPLHSENIRESTWFHCIAA